MERDIHQPKRSILFHQKSTWNTTTNLAPIFTQELLSTLILEKEKESGWQEIQNQDKLRALEDHQMVHQLEALFMLFLMKLVNHMQLFMELLNQRDISNINQ